MTWSLLNILEMMVLAYTLVVIRQLMGGIPKKGFGYWTAGYLVDREKRWSTKALLVLANLAAFSLMGGVFLFLWYGGRLPTH